MMILIDAIYIHNGGGKVLLDYLIIELEKTNIAIYYLLDDRVKWNHPQIKKENKIIYLKSSLLNRVFFYKKNRFSFNKIFCLGNIPPMLKSKCDVMVYFHNPMLLDVPDGFSSLEKIKYFLKSNILNIFKSNADRWFVQSNYIKKKLHEKYKIEQQRIELIPFFPKFNYNFRGIDIREKHSYIYVSNAQPNKNHEKLIRAFCLYYDKYQFGKLILTVSDNFPSIINIIEEMKTLGYPIQNIGFVDRITLQKTYLSTEFLIFPSLAESFGLGLIEALECGCKIIGADLPYTYEVCEPSIVFNPLKTSSIYDAFDQSKYFNEVKESIPKIKNDLNVLIDILIS